VVSQGGDWSCVFGCRFTGDPIEHHREVHGIGSDLDDETCDCVCRCDRFNTYQMLGMLVLCIASLVFASFVMTDGWGLINDC